MKLYRIVPYDPEAGGSHVFVSAREMLVEVELDYEAALIAFKRFWDQPFSNGDDLAMTKAAVDAALEGTDDA